MEDFPWIKFIILSVLFSVPVFMMAPTLKWKLLFIVCVPVGVAIALSGKTLGGYGLSRRI